jgi:hypothetical protein
MKNTKNIVLEKTPIILVVLVYVFYKILFFQTGFFWDSVTILSRPATYLFNHGLFNFIYPSNFENGDPQLVPFYIASVWKIFGRSLVVTHLAFLPILIVNLYLLFRLIKRIFPQNLYPFVFALVASEPTFMSQTLGIYQDGFLILFSLFIINSLLERNKFITAITMLLLCMVSRRGMLFTFGLMVANFVYIWAVQKQTFLKTIKAVWNIYVFAIIFVFSFIYWRLKVYGWFFTTDQTTQGDILPFTGMLRNVLILGRWFADTGKLFLWLVLFYILLKSKNSANIIKQNTFIILIGICLLVIMMSATIPIANPFGARYFVIPFVIFTIIVSKQIIAFLPVYKAKITISILAILLFCGNFWVYPEKLSQSWDSTLSNLAYFELRNQTIEYFDSNNIDFKSVGVDFPMYNKFGYIDASPDNRVFNGVDFDTNQWVVYSNIFNWKDDKIDKVKSWKFVKEFKSGTVFMKIYKKP